MRDQGLPQGLTQATLAERAGISVHALRELEAGRGAQLTSFVCALKGRGMETAIEQLLPAREASPRSFC